MSFREKFIDFLDELLTLFDENIVVYKRLILFRHKIRNVLPADVLIEHALLFVKDETNAKRLAKRDPRFLENTAYETYAPDFDMVWSQMTSANKCLLWQWIESLIVLLIIPSEESVDDR